MSFGFLIIMAVYLSIFAFAVWAVLGLVRSLARMASAQETTARALEQIAGDLARKV